MFRYIIRDRNQKIRKKSNYCNIYLLELITKNIKTNYIKLLSTVVGSYCSIKKSIYSNNSMLRYL